MGCASFVQPTSRFSSDDASTNCSARLHAFCPWRTAYMVKAKGRAASAARPSHFLTCPTSSYVSLSFLCRDSRALPKHLREHADGLLHLGHRAERQAAVRLLERREVARDEHVLRLARVAEFLRRPADVDEHEVRLRV